MLTRVRLRREESRWQIESVSGTGLQFGLSPAPGCRSKRSVGLGRRVASARSEKYQNSKPGPCTHFVKSGLWCFFHRKSWRLSSGHSEFSGRTGEPVRCSRRKIDWLNIRVPGRRVGFVIELKARCGGCARYPWLSPWSFLKMEASLGRLPLCASLGLPLGRSGMPSGCQIETRAKFILEEARFQADLWLFRQRHGRQGQSSAE